MRTHLRLSVQEVVSLRSVFICLFLAATLGACVSRVPNDLAFKRVEAVDYQDQSELSSPAVEPLLGLLGSEGVKHVDLDDWGISGGTEKPHQLLLRVEFTTRTNLAKLVIAGPYNLGYDATFCERPEEHPINLSQIYFEDRLLGPYESDPISSSGGSTGRAPITYHLYLPVEREAIVPSNPPVRAFDLKEKAEDICLRLRGGGNWGFGYRSNVIVVPEEAIAGALKSAPSGI